MTWHRSSDLCKYPQVVAAVAAHKAVLHLRAAAAEPGRVAAVGADHQVVASKAAHLAAMPRAGPIADR